MAGYRAHDAHRRSQLRRACRCDATCRRAVCLFARVAWAALGISLRLDHAPGDSDRDDRSRGNCLRKVYRGDLAVVFRFGLDLENRDVRSLANVVWVAGSLQRRDQPAESSGHCFDRSSHLDQYAWLACGKDSSKRIYSGESRFARGAGSAWLLVFDSGRASN